MTDHLHGDDPEYPGGLEPIIPDYQHTAATIAAEGVMAAARHARVHPAEREERTLTEGFSLTIETKGGVVGLWSCWLRDGFFLGYPESWGEVSAETMAECFGGRSGSATWKPYIDSEERHTRGDWVALGDVPLERNTHNCYSRSFRVLHGDELGQYGPPYVMYGWGVAQELSKPEDLLHPTTGNRVQTVQFWHDADDLDGWKDRLQALKGGFLKLLCKLANAHSPVSVTAELGFVVQPEQLPHMGFAEPRYLRGEPGKREGWQQDAVTTEREVSSQDSLFGESAEQVMLVSANSLVPWVCYRQRLTPSRHVLPGEVEEMLTF